MVNWRMTLGFAVMVALTLAIIMSLQVDARGVAYVLVGAQVLAGGGVLWLAGRALGERERELAACKSLHSAALLTEQEQLARVRVAAQAVIDALPHAVALVSPAGLIELANGEGKMFGLELGKNVDGVPHAWLKKLLTEAVSTRERVIRELKGAVEVREKEALVQMFVEGRELFYLPRSTPLRDAQGNLMGVMVVLVDVTAARQVEEAKASLLSSFSHEFKTPMTSLQMSIYLLLDDAATRLTPRQMELLTAARDDADRLHRLVEKVLAGAREKL